MPQNEREAHGDERQSVYGRWDLQSAGSALDPIANLVTLRRRIGRRCGWSGSRPPKHPGPGGRHRRDDGVWLGGVGALGRTAVLGIDAAVSLCRLGTEDVSGIATEDQATFWLVDSAAAESNACAGLVLQEAAAAVERFRAEGKTVLLHCVRAESRTPTVAALYGARAVGVAPLEALE